MLQPHCGPPLHLQGGGLPLPSWPYRATCRMRWVTAVSGCLATTGPTPSPRAWPGVGRPKGSCQLELGALPGG